MFADRETMERRAEVTKAEWAKAKATWKNYGRVLFAIILVLAFLFTYACGDLHGRLGCMAIREKQDSTP